MTSSPALSGGEGAAAQQVQKFANITGHHFFSYTYNSICLNFIFFLTSYFLLLTSYFLLPTSYLCFLFQHRHHSFQRSNKHVNFLFGIVECKRRTHRSRYAQRINQRLSTMMTGTYCNA